MKKVLLIAGGIILVLVIIGIAVGGSNPSGDAKKVGEANSQSTQEETKTQSEFKIRDRIDFERRVLAVNSVQRNYVEQTQYPLTPQAGKEYILVNVTIENNSDSPVSFNEFDFKLEDSKGVRRNTGYVGQVKNQLNYGELAVGGKVTGDIPFEITKGDTGLKLIFNPSFWTNKEVKVTLE